MNNNVIIPIPPHSSLPSPTFASTSAAYNCAGRGVYLSADDFANAAASCGRQGDVSSQEERPCLSLVWILEAKGKDFLSVMNHTM